MDSLSELENGWKHIVVYLTKVEQIADDSRVHPAQVCGGTIDNKEYMTVFSNVYNIATRAPIHKHSRLIYKRMRGYVQAYLDRVVAPNLRRVARNGDYLIALGKEWHAYAIFARWVRSFFMYLDRFYTRQEGLPKIKTTLLRMFEATALSTVSSAEWENQDLASAFADMTVVYTRYTRSTYASAEVKVNFIPIAYETEPGSGDMDTDMAAATGTFPASARTLALTMPTRPPTRNKPYMGWSSRVIMSELVTNIDFWQNEGACDRVIMQLKDMTRAATICRAYQRLLLATLLTRGADCAKPLVFVYIYLSGDVCDLVRDYLSMLPVGFLRCDIFAWHESLELDTRKRRWEGAISGCKRNPVLF